MKTMLWVRRLAVASFAIVLAASAAPLMAQGTGAMHGRVIDAAGNPVADAVLTFTFIGDYNITLTTKTDAKGNWGRGGMTPGQWNLTVAKGDLGAKQKVQANLGTNTAIADITIVAGAATSAAPAAASATGLEGTVLATPVDSKGVPIKDLAAADWTVREDGASRQISDAKPSTEPLQIVMLIENTRYILPQLKDIATGLTTFVDTIGAGSPESQIAVLGVAGAVTTLSDFTKTTADLDNIFAHLTPSPNGDDVILEGFIEASKRLGRAPSPRRAIVVFHYEGTPESSQQQPQNVAATIMGSGASVWTVSLRGSAQTANAGDRDVVMAGVMPGLGGDRSTISSSSAIGFQMKRIADMLLGQYTLVYKRPAGVVPKALQLAVSRSGAKVFASKLPPGVSVTRTSANAEEVAKHNKRQAELELEFKAGSDAIEAGNYDDAVAKFTAVAKEMTKCAACYSKLGDAYLRKGDLDNAEKSFLKAIDEDPTQADPYNALASLYNTQKKFDEAAKMSTKASELSGPAGGDANSVFNQGIILWNQSKIPEAKIQFQKAVQLDPKLADAHYWLGMSIVNEGKLPESKKEFEEYLKLAPTGQYADTAKAILATIK